MTILVSDRSVLNELERGGLIEHAFSFGLIMVVPDLLYQNEIEAENGPYLRKLGLGVISLTPDEMEFAQSIRAQRPTLSVPDSFALSCSLRQDHALVTGATQLRKEAIARKANVYGLLWILDQMENCGNFTSSLLHEGLSKMAAHPRCKLPKEEVQARLLKWASQSV